MNDKLICVSGGFDPIHIGHLRMMQDASRYGKLIVIVNSDAWLMRKKGYIFMPFEERCEIIQGLTCVHSTTHVEDSDGTVCEALARIRPNFFANGGDRKTDNTPEIILCETNDINLLWSIGGNKIQSSSELINTSPMLASLEIVNEGEISLKPSRVEIVCSGDLKRPADK